VPSTAASDVMADRRSSACSRARRWEPVPVDFGELEYGLLPSRYCPPTDLGVVVVGEVVRFSQSMGFSDASQDALHLPVEMGASSTSGRPATSAAITPSMNDSRVTA